ncbi:MAG: hypothetical protein C9356_12060 [Oleiphilus sp.]|nr:MAG: hypothetical protein C9356_12060 [Oleiphilus sp.]
MQIIKNDRSDQDLTEAFQHAAVNAVRDFIGESKLQSITLFETFHGFVVEFKLKEQYRVFSKAPARLDQTDMRFWSGIAPKLRWFELGEGTTTIALFRTASLMQRGVL